MSFFALSMPVRDFMNTDQRLYSSDHLKNIKPLVESKFWVMGGASLEEPIKEGETPKMNGSVMIAQADTKDEVLEKIRNDIYYTSGVWDESKVSKASLVQVIELAELRRVGGLEGSSFQQD